MIDINNVPAPAIIEEPNFDTIKAAIIASVKERVPDYEPLESDKYMPVIEAVAYREMALRARINEAIKAMLLPTSTGADLDNVVAMYVIDRLKGLKPRADVELSVSTMLTEDKTIRAGTVFTDKERQHFARLIEDVTIPAGDKKAMGVLELEEYTVDSSAETEICVTPLTFVIKADVKPFKGGSAAESDEAFRVRAVESVERFSTAGPKESYKYHALAANPDVMAVHVDSPTPGHVRVVIQVKGDKDRAADDVYKALSEDKVRPFTESISVVPARDRDKTIDAELELLNMFEEAAIIAKIEKTFASKVWGLGEDLNLSYIYKILHETGVYRVRLNEPAADVRIAADEYITVSLNLRCVQAIL